MESVTRRGMLAGSVAAFGGAVGLGTGDVVSPPAAAAAIEKRWNSPHQPVTVTPDDGRYGDMVVGSNRRWVGRPSAIRVVGTADHVVAAVAEAVRSGKRIAVRSGGHCYEGFVYNPEIDTVIDLSEMSRVYFDEDRDAFAVESGATLWQVYQFLYRVWGVTIPGGSCYSVGAGGHLCGGGYGLLSRLYGLTVDYIDAVEVVVVDERGGVRKVVATRDSTDPNHDLWWAHTGGGGGNFGVVTRYWLRDPRTSSSDPALLLPQPPARVFVHAVAWPWEQMTERKFATLLRNFGRWHERNSAPDSPYAGLFSLFKLLTRPTGEISLLTQMDATSPNARQLLVDYLAAVNAGVGVATRPMTAQAGEHPAMPRFFAPSSQPWLDATRSLKGGSWSLYGDYKSAYMRASFPDSQIAALYRHLSTSSNPGNLVQVDSYGCTINSVSSSATAVPQRDSIMKLQYQTYWNEPGHEAERLDWIRHLYQDVYGDTGGVPVPGAVTDGCYINYPDIDLGDSRWNTSGVPWHDLYYKSGYRRLQQAKATWDPGNVFRHTQSVRLPGTT